MVYTPQHVEFYKPEMERNFKQNPQFLSADLLCGLVRDPVHHLAALLLRDGVAVLPGNVLALLLLNISGLHHGLLLAHLAGDLAAVLTRLLNIITNLHIQGYHGISNLTKMKMFVPAWGPGCRLGCWWWSTDGR